jgi:hypothetical protein
LKDAKANGALSIATQAAVTLCKKAAALFVETKSTEPSKRSFKYKLPVYPETSEISVILILLAVISQPVIILSLNIGLASYF